MLVVVVVEISHISTVMNCLNKLGLNSYGLTFAASHVSTVMN